MTVLATTAIMRERRNGGIVASDCLPIEGAHIDVTLGRHYWVFRPYHRRPLLLRWYLMRTRGLDLRDDPREHFVYQQADRHGRIIVPARGFILAHTEEFIGSDASDIVPALGTRSTFARWGGAFCTANAGWGDARYRSRWTGEIINPHPLPMILRAGDRIGYVSFHRAEGAASDYTPGTRYNTTYAQWTPDAMLPRRGNW